MTAVPPPPVAGSPVAVAFCPSPPVLLPAVAGRADAGLTALREACARAVTALLSAAPEVVVVVGCGGNGVRFGAGDVGDLRGFGVDVQVPFSVRARRGGRRLPWAHTLGAWLLDRAGHVGTRLGVGPADLADALGVLPAPVGVLVVGDGSARRTDRAPASFDAPAGPFDAAVASSLAAGDPAALAALDPEGERLLATGVAAWRAVGAVLAGRPVDAATRRYDDAPFGVGYLVADWQVP